MNEPWYQEEISLLLHLLREAIERQEIAPLGSPAGKLLLHLQGKLERAHETAPSVIMASRYGGM